MTAGRTPQTRNLDLGEAVEIVLDEAIHQEEATQETGELGYELRMLRHGSRYPSRENLILALAAKGVTKISTGRAITIPLLVYADTGRLKPEIIRELIAMVRSLRTDVQ